MLDICDQLIKFDRAGVLRLTFLHQNIELLAAQEIIPHKQPLWLYLDPQGQENLIKHSWTDIDVKSTNSPTMPKDTEVHAMTEAEVSQLRRSPNPYLLQKFGQQRVKRLSHSKMISLDDLRMRCETNFYFTAEKFRKDFAKLINWNLLYRTQSIRGIAYITKIVNYFHELILKKQLAKRFEEKLHTDMIRLFKYETELKVECKEYPSIPTEFREYQPLTEYVPVPESRRTIIQKKLLSLKQPIDCSSDCACLRPSEQKFCQFSLFEGTWISQCPNRANRIECNHLDESQAARCRNSQIKKKERKVCRSEGDTKECDIEQCIIWGIDAFTRKNVFYLLPQRQIAQHKLVENIDLKNQFIDQCLLKAMNFLGTEGYDMKKTCNFIIKHSSIRRPVDKGNQWAEPQYEQSMKGFMFGSNFRKYAKKLLEAIEASPDPEAFRIHSKGKGARCLRKQGIRSSEFIVEYFGELYEPWRWYERQDFTKKAMRMLKMTDVPDFYNICLQKHPDEKQGYDMLVVDPIHKGNFSSRFSHSCNPNCGTITTVSDGRYYIGMYALREIGYGQQLTFDYCSTTESRHEHKHAICLCGTKQCRGNYLQLSISKPMNNILDKYYCFQQRTVVLLNSINELTEEDMQILERHKLGDNILANSPTWLVKWSALVLKFLEFERQQHYRNVLKQMMEERNQNSDSPVPTSQLEPNQKQKIFADVGKHELFSGRFQNLVTTIDKLNYYLQSIEDAEPPLKQQSDSDSLEALFQSNSNNDQSTMEQLEHLLKKDGYQTEKKIIQQFKHIIGELQTDKDKLAMVRYCFLVISHHLKQNKYQHSLSNKIISDILYMYSFTHHYFCPHEYASHSSEPITISPREFLNYSAKKDEAKRKDFQDTRKYSSQFVWGQLVAWYKQTIAQPQASLSQDRRGTLSYPTFETICHQNCYPFEGNNRQNFLKALIQRPSASWPPQKCPWSYKNNRKSYGTMLFQSFYSAQKLKSLEVANVQLSKEPGRMLISAALALIDKPFREKLKLFSQIQVLIGDRNPKEVQELLEKYAYGDGEYEECKRTYEQKLPEDPKRSKRFKAS